MTSAAGTASRRSTPVGSTLPAPRLVLPARVPANGLYSARLKRWFDLALGRMSFPVTIPLGLFVALIIKFDSPGPILVRLERVGKGGSRFGQYKFRTMIAGAEQVLRELLESDTQIRKEFEATYKIKNDPRVTGVGCWLAEFQAGTGRRLASITGHGKRTGWEQKQQQQHRGSKKASANGWPRPGSQRRPSGCRTF